MEIRENRNRMRVWYRNCCTLTKHGTTVVHIENHFLSACGGGEGRGEGRGRE